MVKVGNLIATTPLCGTLLQEFVEMGGYLVCFVLMYECDCRSIGKGFGVEVIGWVNRASIIGNANIGAL